MSRIECPECKKDFLECRCEKLSPVESICPVCKEKKEIYSADFMLGWIPRCEECWDKRWDHID